MTYITLRPTAPADTQLITQLMTQHWGGEPLLIRAKKYYPTKLDGIFAIQNQEVIGFLFYDIQGADCEIVVFEVFDKFKGIGTQLLNELKSTAKNKNCQRIYLMTTNDSLDALRFYQCRGFHICKMHLDSVKKSRAIKPSIPLLGEHGIPLRDEIDLEYFL